MMQNTKLTSTTGVATVKKEVNDALNQLEASSGDTQRVYTNLTRIFNALADLPQAQLVVDSSLAAQKSVKLFNQLVRMHLREEEVQWVLGRVISLACQASVRFQCQAGQFEMWKELFDMRSTHPQSIRVQEASLRASEALFRNNEFHITNLSPQQFLDDLLAVMDRFMHIQTPRRRAHELVVLALRVLVALYSSPRPTGLMLFNGKGPAECEKWVGDISRRMLGSFALFKRKNDSIRLWLDMVLLLLRQHPGPAMKTLFSPTLNKETTWWFVAVIERWQNEAETMNSLLATLTYIFALPRNTLGDETQVSLAEKLIVEQNLLDLICEVIDHYHQTIVHGTSSTQLDIVVLVLLETIRVVRQWSERSKILPRFEVSPSVKSTLLPVLIEQLHLQSKPSVLSPKKLVLVLEVLLVLRHLAASFSLRGVLVGSESLQTSLKRLRCGTSNAGDDGDLNVLVAREVRNVHKLITPGLDATPKGNPQTAIVVSKTMTRQSRQLRAELVKAETRRAYCSSKR